MSKNKKKFIIIFFIILFVDFIFSNIFFNKTTAWHIKSNQKKPWRVESKNYHHGLLPLINVNETWGLNKQTLITNSLGFRDSSNRVVEKYNSKKRILLVGDSFIEGLGYDYEFTLAGLIQNHYGEKYEILNSAVSSYSPSIYYLKTKYLIDQGFKFNKTIIFLDVSDIIDENFLQFNDDGTLVMPNNKKNNIHTPNFFFNIFASTLKENFVTFKFLSVLSDKTEILKNYIKDNYKVSKFLKKNYFKISNRELNLFRMINVDRGNWTKNNNLSKEAKIGVKSSERHLTMLVDLLKKNNIEVSLIIYPWPAQIFYEDFHHKQYWRKFAVKKKISFLNLYPYFDNGNKSDAIINNFILGDVHWNKKGTSSVFNALLKNGIL